MLGMRILRDRKLIESLKLDSAVMLNFLWKVRALEGAFFARARGGSVPRERARGGGGG